MNKRLFRPFLMGIAIIAVLIVLALSHNSATWSGDYTVGEFDFPDEASETTFRNAVTAAFGSRGFSFSKEVPAFLKGTVCILRTEPSESFWLFRRGCQKSRRAFLSAALPLLHRPSGFTAEGKAASGALKNRLCGKTKIHRRYFWQPRLFNEKQKYAVFFMDIDSHNLYVTTRYQTTGWPLTQKNRIAGAERDQQEIARELKRIDDSFRNR